MAEREVLELAARELRLPVESVERAAALLAEGATPPFLSRYRRELTGDLREGQVRALDCRLRELEQLAGRKAKLLGQIEGQGRLSEALRERIDACADRLRLDELAAPFRSRHRTRGVLARERGLGPLADALANPPPEHAQHLAEGLAAAFVRPEAGLPDVCAVLDGARHILAERLADSVEVRDRLRAFIHDTAVLRATAGDGKPGGRGKHEKFHDYAEPLRSVPPHRVLALRRGVKEGALRVWVETDRERVLAMLREAMPVPPGPSGASVETALADAWDRLLAPALESEALAALKHAADREAVEVLARNLRGLLLQPAAGARRTLGVLPGHRHGCHLAAVDVQGAVLETLTVYPLKPQAKVDEARDAVRACIDTHQIEAVAIGNGTGSREADLFLREVLRAIEGRQLVRMIVHDAGLKLWSTSRAARDELSALEPPSRCAVGLARRLQDPLTQCAQIDPKAIAVGQYHHEVNQEMLREALAATMASCVALVGADPATATAAHLAHVPGLDRAIAHEIAEHRKQHGPLRCRADLMAIPRVDERRFEQAAAFLRIANPGQPLDATTIHPERYGLVARIAADAGTDVAGLLGNRQLVNSIDFPNYVADGLGAPTLKSIRHQLLHPGRDPRGPFRCVRFRDDVTTVEHLQQDMILEGVVTSVANFGAFVDVGVDADGLVHVSELASRYVTDANRAVRVGDVVRVKVVGVDLERRRVSLSIKQAVPPPRPKPPRPKPRPEGGRPDERPRGDRPHKDRKPDERPRDDRRRDDRRRDDSRAEGRRAEGRRPDERRPPERPTRPPKPRADRTRKATPEEIARLIAHFQRR